MKPFLLFPLLIAASLAWCEAASIEGPTKVPLGTPAIFLIEGIPPEHLDKFDWQVYNKPADAMVLDLADRAGNPVLMFWSRTPGKCAVIADVNVPPDQFQLIIHEFVVEGSEPNPPPPPPPPPPPSEVTWCLFLYESDDIDDRPWMANIRTSQKIRALESPDFVLKFADKDEKNEDNNPFPSTKLWVDYATEKKLDLPLIIFVGKTGKLVRAVPFPNTVDETVVLVRGYKP